MGQMALDSESCLGLPVGITGIDEALVLGARGNDAAIFVGFAGKRELESMDRAGHVSLRASAFSHSDRSACIGSTDAARLAGTRAAPAATTIIAARDRAKLAGSNGDIRYNIDVSCFAAKYVKGIPAAIPAKSTQRLSRSTMATTCMRLAPRAMRTPISVVRRLTRNECIP
jgi:hypothetical protein